MQLTIDVTRQLKHDDVIERLAWLMATRIECWRMQHNTVRPLSVLGYRPPASETWLVVEPNSTALRWAQQPYHITDRLT